MDLICNGPIIDFYKNGVKLSSGEEKNSTPQLCLTKKLSAQSLENAK